MGCPGECPRDSRAPLVDLERQEPAGLEAPPRAGQEAPRRIEAIRAAHQGVTRLPRPYRRVEVLVFRFGEIRGIGHDRAQPLACERSEEVAFPDFDRHGGPYARDILPRQRGGRGHPLDPDDAVERSLDGERERDAAACRPDVGTAATRSTVSGVPGPAGPEYD